MRGPGFPLNPSLNESMNKHLIAVLAAGVALLTGCASLKSSSDCADGACDASDGMNFLILTYSNAVEDASHPLAAKASTHLTPLTPDNPRLSWRTNSQGVVQVKAATFMTRFVATNYWAPGMHSFTNRDQWFTAYPDLKEFCAKYKGTNVLLRIKELLGLPPTSQNDTVAEFWVSPEVVFRPAPEPAINSVSAGVSPSPRAPLIAPNYRIPDFWVDWFNQFYASCDYGMTKGVTNSFPWTQLGYTYDWAPGHTKHFGLSEFVIPSGTLYDKKHVAPAIEVEALIPAEKYGK